MVVSATARLGLLKIAGALALAVPIHVSSQDYQSKYRYVLEAGKGTRVCDHMTQVYNERLASPWDVTLDDASKPLGMILSRYPGSKEFDAIEWREGRYSRGSKDYPMLVSQFDIDNDGRQDDVVKMSFMRSFYPAGRGASGGEDELFVLPAGHLNLKQVVASDAIYARERPGTTSRIGPDLLGLEARQIRPFVFEGRTYLSVYEQLSVFPAKKRRERMWVLLYRSGGKELSLGKWQPVDAERTCRFQMVLRD